MESQDKVIESLTKTIEITKARVFFMNKVYLALLDLSVISSKMGGDSRAKKNRL